MSSNTCADFCNTSLCPRKLIGRLIINFSKYEDEIVKLIKKNR